MTNLKVTQVKSSIGTKPKHRGTLRALGLRGIGAMRRLVDVLTTHTDAVARPVDIDEGFLRGAHREGHQKAGTRRDPLFEGGHVHRRGWRCQRHTSDCQR